MEEPRETPRLVVVGAGELGGRVAALAAARGDEVLAVTRTRGRHATLAAAGARPLLVHELPRLEARDRLLLAVPGASGQLEALRSLEGAECLAPRGRAVLVSSTGVHGDPRGRVDEDTPRGTEERARSLGEVEEHFRDRLGPAAVVLRPGGLFRPGRGPFAAWARRGQVPADRPDRRLPLVHYDDLAGACLAALDHPAPHPFYLVVTSAPPRAEFQRAARERLGLPALQDPPDATPPWPDYDTTRMERDLLPAPAWPDWRAALA